MTDVGLGDRYAQANEHLGASHEGPKLADPRISAGAPSGRWRLHEAREFQHAVGGMGFAFDKLLSKPNETIPSKSQN
ncbi:hypothetical protein [Paraburkholderia sp. BCC1886]|uniref:hypothetical protein n=1 Tax=Paraburkholderia sp. BCC1886 TaxID=2562670 RepID=UPI001184146F|nr:hypothetical protein [Paraburkholderia sp. BCC1886]